jgi:hypothetical protein
MDLIISLTVSRLTDGSKVYVVSLTQEGQGAEPDTVINLDLKAFGEPAALDALHQIAMALKLHVGNNVLER